MNDIKVGQIWENKHLFNDAYDVVVCWVNDGFVWSHYTDDDDLVKESQSDFLRLRRLKSDPYFLNDNQKIVFEQLKLNAGSNGSLTKAIHSLYNLLIISSNRIEKDGAEGLLKAKKSLARLTRKQEAEIMQAFSTWVLEQEVVE
ncbi:hypothetical protein ACOX9P_09165 [Enterococcus durans]|uniref:hypothetical protein n=1 Tax=Enterococcus durans TaxID=53345 RepID=UPI003BEEEB74